MKYAFNGFLFSQRPTGVMRYAREILQEMDKFCNNLDWVLVVPEYAENVPNLTNIKTIRFGNIKGNLWEQIEFSRFIKKNSYESVNFNNTMPLQKSGIIVIHDIAYKLHPEFSNSVHGKLSNIYHRIIFKRAAKGEKPIITVTHFSKIQLVEYYNIEPDRIHVIGNAWQHMEKIGVDKGILNKYSLKKNSFYFSLGSLSKMKNTKWVYKVAKENPDKLFVLAGARPKSYAEELTQPQNVILVGFVTDEEVKTLINNCKAFIYPSIYDGFGIPPLEALSQGAKVICSNAACLPEVYRNSVYYIDPYETNVDLDSLLNEKIDEAKSVLIRYSWEESAKRFFELLIEYAKTVDINN